MTKQNRLITAIIVSIVFALTDQLSAGQKTILQLRWDHQFQFAGYYAAQWKGFYDKAGIDVEIRSAVPSSQTILKAVTEVSEGRADFGIGAADILLGLDQGAELSVLAVIFQQSAVRFYHKKSTRIDSLADLMGLRVSRNVNDLIDMEYQAMLLSEGIKASAIAFVDHVPGIDHLINGDIDLRPGYSISIPYLAKKRGVTLREIRPSTYGIDFYGDTLFSTAELARRQPDFVKNFIKASLKGWEYALTHSEEIADKISSDLPRVVPVDDVTAFNRFQIDGVRSLTLYPVVELGHVNPNRWRRMNAFLNQLGLIKSDLNLNQLVFDPKRLEEQKRKKNLKILVVAASLTLITALFFIMWIIVLQKIVKTKTAHLIKSKELLREGEEKFKHVFESSNVGKSITLVTGEVHPNRALADFLGYGRNELIGKRWQDLTPVQDIETIETMLDALITGKKKADRFERRYVHKTGRILWADVSIAMHRDAKGKPLYFITTVVDIAARKEAEAAVKHSEAYLRALVTCSPIALYSLDADGRVLSWNRSAEKMFGWQAAEILGKDLPTVPEDRKEAFESLRHKVFEGNTFLGKELVRAKKDGTLFPIRLSVDLARNDRGEAVSAVCAAEDITEHKKLESQLLHAQKMEFVGRLAGGVAHDYNNMLSVIIGFSELALTRTEPGDEMHDDLTEILNAAKRSADITRQLLAFARRQTIAPRVLDLNETVDNMLNMLRRLIGEDIDLCWKPGDGLWPVKMDPSQLDQVFANLCVNSRDAIKDVGKITIETGNHRFDEGYCIQHPGFLPGEYVLLGVSDDGRGMTREIMDQVFEPFFTTKENGRGTGLGLATVYGIVRQNKGFINVYSEPGTGTTFRIYLPRETGEARQKQYNDPGDSPRGSGETIMIAEDEPAILALAERILQDAGYNVLTAPTPQKALDMAKSRRGRIDLLVTDVVLPEMNGRKLAEKLMPLCPRLKVLFMSGYTANVIAHRGVLEDGVQFIPKPFSARDLAAKVYLTLAGEPDLIRQHSGVPADSTHKPSENNP